jgi:hypothetical protein
MIALVLAAEFAAAAAPPVKVTPDCAAAIREAFARDQQRNGGQLTPRSYACENGTVRVQKAGGVVASRMPNAYKVPEKCKTRPTTVVDRFGRPVATRLADLPKGALYYAIDTRIDGCPVLTVVYGEALRDDPNPPPSAYRAVPLKPKS